MVCFVVLNHFGTMRPLGGTLCIPMLWDIMVCSNVG